MLAFTLLLAIAGATMLWWSYFDRFAETVEGALRAAGDSQGVLARDAYSLGHYPMIVGVVLFAAAAEEIVANPGEPLGNFTRLLVTLSISLAMLTQSAVVKRVGGAVLTERIAAAVVVGLLMVPALEIRANVMLLAVVVIVITALAIERQRERMPVVEV